MVTKQNSLTCLVFFVHAVSRIGRMMELEMIISMNSGPWTVRGFQGSISIADRQSPCSNFSVVCVILGNTTALLHTKVLLFQNFIVHL